MNCCRLHNSILGLSNWVLLATKRACQYSVQWRMMPWWDESIVDWAIWWAKIWVQWWPNYSRANFMLLPIIHALRSALGGHCPQSARRFGCRWWIALVNSKRYCPRRRRYPSRDLLQYEPFTIATRFAERCGRDGSWCSRQSQRSVPSKLTWGNRQYHMYQVDLMINITLYYH